MSTIEILEPAPPCSTGRGPGVPQELVTFMAAEPTAFAESPAVAQFLRLSGSDCY